MKEEKDESHEMQEMMVEEQEDQEKMQWDQEDVEKNRERDHGKEQGQVHDVMIGMIGILVREEVQVEMQEEKDESHEIQWEMEDDREKDEIQGEQEADNRVVCTCMYEDEEGVTQGLCREVRDMLGMVEKDMEPEITDTRSPWTQLASPCTYVGPADKDGRGPSRAPLQKVSVGHVHIGGGGLNYHFNY